MFDVWGLARRVMAPAARKRVRYRLDGSRFVVTDGRDDTLGYITRTGHDMYVSTRLYAGLEISRKNRDMKTALGWFRGYIEMVSA